MIGYNTAYIIVVLCLLISLTKDKKLNRMAYIVMGVVLVCLCGFRHVAYISGNDSYIYYYNFLRSNEKVPIYMGQEYNDVAFLGLTKLIRFFTSNVYVYGSIIALLTITPVLYLYKKVSPFPLIAVFLYVCMQVGGSSPYFMAYNQFRQTLAVGFLCVAIYFYAKNEYKFNWKVIVFLLIMGLTHWSSVIMVIPFILKKVYINKYVCIGGMLGAAVAGFFAVQFVPQLKDLFLLLEQGFFIDDYKEFSLISNLPLLLLSSYAFFISSKEECNSFEHKCLFLQFVVFGLLAPFNNSIFRFCIYYGVIGNLAIASSFYKSLKKKDAITAVVAIVAFLYISRVLLISLVGWEKEFPYSMFGDFI